MARNFTQELKDAVNEGSRVVCSLAPYEGQLVEYRPRSESDPSPWVLTSWPDGYRYSGRECHAVNE